MTEEEKKAIERIEDTFYNNLAKGIKDFQKITLYEDSIQDIRMLLNLIEKLQKENEKLKNKLLDITKGKKVIEEETPQYIKENYIPVQKVKDKIEEEELPLVIVGGRRNKKTLEYGIQLGRILALRELLEGGRK